MTPEQKSKCHTIIHSCAAGAGLGNVVPVPGLGIAADMAAMAAMATALCAVFGGSITKEAAKTLAIAAMKRTMLQMPIRTITKEAGKIIPYFGSMFAASVSVGMVEAAGWVLAKELDDKNASSR